MAKTKTEVTETKEAMDVAAEIESEAEVQKRRDAHNWERVPYFARKPEGLAKDETHFVVTLAGKNYRYAYNTPLMIPRCIYNILKSQADMLNQADVRAAAWLTKGGSGVNLGTY